MRILLAATSTAFAILVFGLAMRFEASLQPANPGQSKAAEEAKVEQSVVPRGWSKTGYPGVFYRWCEKKITAQIPITTYLGWKGRWKCGAETSLVIFMSRRIGRMKTVALSARPTILGRD
jgi:hypothetical protein